MKIQCLGVHDSLAPGKGSMCLLIDGTLALDAGAITDTLPFEQQVTIRDVIVSHVHIDHVKTLPFLAESFAISFTGNIVQTLRVHAKPAIIRALKAHLFNNVLWPDFTTIPSVADPVLTLIDQGQTFVVQGYTITFIPLTHTVPTYAIHVQHRDSEFLYISDTGPTERIWQYINQLERPLDAIFIDVAFPNSLENLAWASGHLTPKLLRAELGKVTNIPKHMYAIHLKSVYIEKISKELVSALDGYDYSIPKPMDILTL
ncbi:3',5'-cyclic-nucleotide phosphodiesterase [Chrysiogenes arsenatis]|uniref:3',5'-cyclic-nucleotide phosphodiesterase n=1 Tax=Chrysiogenes arsenatis TaxID=309797 RepID=UPI000411CBF7|nr:3',5'-cyclic-nucleotide phosphodiesterase [Chrysiogenes arsenatis]